MPSLNLQNLPACPPSLIEAIESAPMPPLQSGSTDSRLDAWIEANENLAFSGPPAEQLMAAACRSGMWLLAGDLDRSHSISQDISAAEGSFWHGIMHRREGDFGNAKYWFSKVGAHPVFAVVGREAHRQHLMDDPVCFQHETLEPLAFVDVCHQTLRREDEQSENCRMIQWLEWQALFFHCLRKAWPEES